MERFELFMMKISRVFSLSAMTIIFLVICIVLIFMFFGYGSQLLKPSVPDVSFSKSYFTESPTPAKADIATMTGEERMNFLASKGAKALRPAYEKRLAEYMDREKSKLFTNEETAAADMEKYKKDKSDAFEENTKRVFYYSINNLPKKYEEPYISQAVEFILDADKSGTEAFTDNNIPISTLAGSKVLRKFDELFRAQMRQIESDQGSGGSTLISTIGLAILMSLIFIFLMFSIMLAIIRIEKKLKEQ